MCPLLQTRITGQLVRVIYMLCRKKNGFKSITITKRRNSDRLRTVSEITFQVIGPETAE